MTILGHIRTTVLIALTIILVAWGTTQAADTSIIFTPPETIVGDVGEQAVVYLALDSGLAGVHGYRVKFKFDTTVLHLDTIVTTPEWNAVGAYFFSYKDSLEVDSATGDSNWYYDVSSYYLGQGLEIDGYANIAELTFSAHREGASFLYFDYVLVQDGQLNAITDSVEIAMIFVCPLPEGYSFLGDFDQSGRVDIGDLTFLIQYLFIQGPPPSPTVLMGDVNCDGVVDIGDLTRIIDYLFISFSSLCDLCQ
ncbi:MAG: hypothetical protein JSU65_07285 [Candidatus Zixiibacteriota bacterium]|nr:MAG: hypothetical protein JSU65_07285 [candidate division Zixibacteria bacterium]